MRKTFNIRGGNYADVMNPTLEAFALVVCHWYFRAMYQLNMVMLHSLMSLSLILNSWLTFCFMSRAKSARTSSVPSSDLLRRLRGQKFPVTMEGLALGLVKLMVRVLVRQQLPLLAVAPLALALVLRRPMLNAHPVWLCTS